MVICVLMHMRESGVYATVAARRIGRTWRTATTVLAFLADGRLMPETRGGVRLGSSLLHFPGMAEACTLW